VTAYVYRLKSPGVAGAEVLVTTHTLDISCISADLTAPPTSGLSLTNVSAAQRTGAEASKNYYGDRFRVQENSSTGATLTAVGWDWNVASLGNPPTPTFSADISISGALPNASLTDFNPSYFPCDPSGSPAGDPRSGSTCYGSVGSPASGSSFRMGIQTTNANGSGDPFISAPVVFTAPLADIVGLDRTTNPFTLRVLRGGTTDAGASQGNLADASFFWTFSTPSGPLTGADISTTNPVITVPTAATGFRMRVTYRGGYVSPDVTGNLSQVDLVPSFSVSPATVVKNGSVTLTNQMQIAPAASLTSVDAAITNSSTPPATFSGTLGAGFLSANGTATQTVPGTAGSYFVHLRYNYTVSGAVQSPIVVTKPLSVIDQIILSLTANPDTANTGTPIQFTATGGNASSVYGWNFGDNPFAATLTPGGATNSHSYTSPGSFLAIACESKKPATRRSKESDSGPLRKSASARKAWTTRSRSQRST